MRKLFILLLLIVGGYWVYITYIAPSEVQDVFTRLDQNYSAQIEETCQTYQLPAEYFKALIILESSAKLPAPTRFEPHVFERLKDVQTGKSERYGAFTTAQMKLYDDATLKKLATSWGPLQIMGYHCIPLGLDFEQLQGTQAVKYAIEWADKSYGQYLREGDFTNAFHIHNTGRPVPASGQTKTYDPDYIRKGMALIKKIRERQTQQENSTTKSSSKSIF